MNAPQQIYLTVARPHITAMIDKYTVEGYLLIQSADVTSNKVLLTFEKMSEQKPEPKPLVAFKFNSSDEIPDSLLEEVFKK